MQTSNDDSACRKKLLAPDPSRSWLLLLLLPQGQQTDARDLDDLEPHTGDLTLGLALATEPGQEDLVVLVDKVKAAVVGNYATLPSVTLLPLPLDINNIGAGHTEGSDLLAILDQLHSHALPNGRVGLLGFDADLLEDDALGV